MVRDTFATFILTHGRPNKVATVKTLMNKNYSGKWYLLLDDEDDTYEEYVAQFGLEHVITFSKNEILNDFDIMDNFAGNKVIVFARNAVNKIAKDMGLKYFWELEDDYYEFNIRTEVNGHLPILQVENIDDIIEVFLDFLDKTPVDTIAFAQNGEMMGGAQGEVWKSQCKRKAMNTFFFRVDRLPEERGNQFLGRMNDDVNWYITAGRVGKIILQTPRVTLRQEMTQKSASGNTVEYKALGTYVKSFYSVMLRPDCVSISVLFSNRHDQQSHPRIHHHIDWETCVPKIVSSRYKKHD